ncbi:uncharacterized protein DNG_05527 [Cephalotrichum gorgonifer]|uniref:PHD-type domain-containing protein n=1 Tax=Cephalotrichum gorgonifer TaxID=2041049 RepID=A0AAE8SVJ4_9PEZI|nr:uncharacterized protein DNG_05527 [Cephalotrichum gorgonifer]
MASNTRATRSRYSSPAQGQAAQAGGGGGGAGPLETNKNSGNEASRAFMRKWMEPAVQQKATFEQAGMMRYGVLENMQPLGTLPKGSAAAKKNAAATPENNGPVRKIILRPSGSGSSKKNAAEVPVAHSSTSSSATHSRKPNRVQQQGNNGTSSKPSPTNSPSPPPSSASSPPSISLSPTQRSPHKRLFLSSTTSPLSLPSSRKSASKANLRDSIEKDGSSVFLPDLAPPPPEPRARRSLTMKDLDDDYQPQVKVSTTKRTTAATRSPATRRSLTRASAGRQSLPAPAPAPAPVSEPSPGGVEPSVSASASDDASGDSAAKRRRLVGKVVDEAVESALKYHRYPTAYALRTVYDENSTNPRITAMFEAVFLQRADADTLNQFTALISERKRRGARNNVAYGHWDLTGIPEKPVPAPYGDLLRTDVGDGTRAQKKQKTTHTDSPSFSRLLRKEAGVTALVGGANSNADATAKVPATPTRRRGRSDSLGSDSSLSSAISFDTPSQAGVSSLDLNIVAKPNGDAHRPKTQIKLKLAQPSSFPAKGQENKPQPRNQKGSGSAASGKGRPAKAGGKVGSSTGMTTPAAASAAGGEDDVSVSGAPPVDTQPIAGRGRTAVAQQRKSPATTGSTSTSTSGTNPASAGRAGGSAGTKNRDTLSSSSTSVSPPISTDPDQLNNLDSRDNAGPDEIGTRIISRDMPGIVTPLFPNLPVKTSGLRTALQQQSQSDTPNGDPKKRASRASEINAEGAPAKPQDVADVSETRARSETPATGRKTRNASRAGAAATPPALAGFAPRSTRSAVKRVHEETEGTTSPTASVFRSGAPSEAATRASTPVLPPPSKRQRVGPRVKTSPKKSGNTAAGLPRPTAVVASGDQIDNDDFCSSCGGNGGLICCDGCSKSFHFECVDLVGSVEPPPEWYCTDCAYKLLVSRPDHRGPFGPLLNTLEKTIPRAFSLPKKIQTYFEDTKVGANGEYEEIDRTAKLSKKDRNQEFDFFQQRDADGNAILCHGCQKAAAADKIIISCSACPLYWHIDCLDTPAAHPPNPRKWVCPAHVDRFFFDENALLGRRFRKVRGAQVIKPVYRRGNRNNGIIEVDDSEEAEGGDASGWKDVKSYGRVLRLPAQGIKLDFIEQLRKVGAGRVTRGEAPSKDTAQQSRMWDTSEAEAAITLCRLRELESGTVQVGHVANTEHHNNHDGEATTKAPDAVALLTQIQAGRLTSDSLSATDKQSLRAMMDSIKMALGDEPQEISINDGIYDGASTTPEASEEAVTPKADADKAVETGMEEEAMGEDVVRDVRDGIEVVGEGEEGGVCCFRRGVV